MAIVVRHRFARRLHHAHGPIKRTEEQSNENGPLGSGPFSGPVDAVAQPLTPDEIITAWVTLFWKIR